MSRRAKDLRGVRRTELTVRSVQDPLVKRSETIPTDQEVDGWRVRLLQALASTELESKDRLSEELDGWNGWDRLSTSQRHELTALLGSLNLDLLCEN